jgi:hypothetical protein
MRIIIALGAYLNANVAQNTRLLRSGFDVICLQALKLINKNSLIA